MKKTMILVAVATVVGNSVFSMESTVQTTKEGLGTYLPQLPKDIRKYILSLTLELKYEQTKQIALEKNVERVSAVIGSPDGKTILAGVYGPYNKTAVLLNAGTEEKLQRFIGHTGIVKAVAFSPDGKTVLTGSADRTARLWNVTTGQELRQFAGPTKPVNSVAFSPDGKTVLAVSDDETAYLWDVNTGETLFHFLNGCYSAAFSKDDKTILIGSAAGTAYLWDIKTGKELQKFTSQGGAVLSVACSPDGKTVLTGLGNGKAYVWDSATGKQIQLLNVEIGLINSIAFSPDGTMALTKVNNGKALLWDIFTGILVKTFGEIQLNPVSSAAFSSDGKTIIAGNSKSVGPSISLYELKASPLLEKEKKESVKMGIQKELYLILTEDAAQEEHQ